MHQSSINFKCVNFKCARMKHGFFLICGILLAWLTTGIAAFAQENIDDERLLMITSHAPDQVAVIDVKGRTLWSLGPEDGVEHPQDAAVTEDGNLFFSVQTGAKMVRMSDKKLLWSYTAPEGTQNPVAQPLENGLFLVGNEGPCQLLEINAQSEVKRLIKVNDSPFQGAHGQFRFCRKTPEGTYLFPMINAGILREYDADGKQLRQFPVTGMPVAAIRLPLVEEGGAAPHPDIPQEKKSGDTVAGCGSAVEQYDAENRLVWRFDCVEDGHLKPGLVTAVSRLKNGNTLIGYYHNDPSCPDIIEISPDKKIVWSLNLPKTGLVAAVEILDKNRKPSNEILAR